MKTYTVNTHHWTGLTNETKSLVSPGIQVSTNPNNPKQLRINLGEYAAQSVWKWVPLAFKNAPKVLVDHILNAQPIKISEEKGYFLAEQRFENPRIMVRITTKTERCLNLQVGALGENDVIIAEGNGHYGPRREKFDDLLVVLEPHSAAIITQNGKRVLAVVNNSGQADIVSAEDYKTFFLPNYLASKEVEPAPAPVEVKKTGDPVVAKTASPAASKLRVSVAPPKSEKRRPKVFTGLNALAELEHALTQ